MSEGARLRLAFVGKGGSGKSFVVGTLARLLARRGEPVLVLDSDPMPGLVRTLGMSLEESGLPGELVEEDPDEPRSWRLAAGADGVEVVEQHARRGPDDVRLVQLGKLRGPASDLGLSHRSYHALVDDLTRRDALPWHVIGDLPGGTRQAFLRWGRFATRYLVVAEPTGAGVLTARRLGRVTDTPGAVQVVANKVRGPDDTELIARQVGTPVVGSVPWDDDVAAAARAGTAPVDRTPVGTAVDAVGSLAERLLEDL